MDKQEKKAVKTAYTLEKERRNKEIREEYKKLISEPGAMSTAVYEILMKKHKIHSRATIWAIIKTSETIQEVNV